MIPGCWWNKRVSASAGCLTNNSGTRVELKGEGVKNGEVKPEGHKGEMSKIIDKLKEVSNKLLNLKLNYLQSRIVLEGWRSNEGGIKQSVRH